ncbi:MAG TPA: DUF4399 domain-containing protein [Gammaproteobacteria bacterium]|nr:DUF4399 domain-containing protein [Gammaproteobacteria bacterium]
MSKKKMLVSSAMLLTLFSGVSVVQAHTPPAHAKVYFIGLDDGAVVQSPVKVKFGIEGFGITPAGTKGKHRHTAGHHHLLVDVDTAPNLDEPVPRDAHHLHFDQGETEAVLDLKPGQHTLQLLLGDEDHEPQDPALMSKKITITVKPSVSQKTN